MFRQFYSTDIFINLFNHSKGRGMKFFSLILATVLTFGAAVNTFAAENAPATEDKMVAVIILMDEGDDQKVVTTIYTSMASAEKVAKALDIEMVASDDPVEDVFVFALKSQEQKDLTLKMFDEEGYELAAHRVMEVVEGNNYNALNVESLNDGTYIFELTDAEGAVYTREVIVEKGSQVK